MLAIQATVSSTITTVAVIKQLTTLRIYSSYRTIGISSAKDVSLIKSLRKVQPLVVMSSSSPFIKRAKGRSNIRQRDESASGSPLAGSSDQVGTGDDDDDVGMSPMMMAKNRKKEKEKKKTGTAGKTRLSFGGEEEVGQTNREHPSKPCTF